MINKSFKSKMRTAISLVLSVLIWLVLWEVLALIIDIEFIFPGAIKTFKTLSSLIFTSVFWKTIFASMYRILLGLIFGILIGIALAFLHQFLPFAQQFISIGMTLIKSTPVASIIMVLWVLIGSAHLPTAIGLLMVAPIIWQNLTDAFSSIDKDLAEVCDVFEFTPIKRFKILIYPSLLKYFVPAALTSIGLAWKSGIAAEIIAYTKNSIGKSIFDAKNYFEGDVMLAWTISVVVISLCFEQLTKFLIRRFVKNAA